MLCNNAKFSRAIKKLGKKLSNREITKLENRIKYIVINSEKSRDSRRKNILTKLKFPQRNESVIKIFNDTDTPIPPNILKILKYGIDRPVDGNPNKVCLLAACENLFKNWTQFCNGEIDQLTMLEVRANLFVNFCTLGKCYADNNDLKEIKQFLTQNPEIIICPVDKSKNINLIYIEDYRTKLLDVFSDPEKFELLPNDPLETDLTDFRALLRTMEPYLSKKTY